MSFSFASPRAPRRPSLTPMIDVVFLLLVFFMLATRFGQEATVPLSLAGGGGSYSGPPRLVEVSETEVLLNGRAVSLDAAVAAMDGLTQAPGDAIVFRSQGADVQRVIDVLVAFSAAGYTALVLVE